MSRSGSTSVGEPEVLSPEQAALVRNHLDQILASHFFAGSKRTQDFLRLIVTHTLEGDLDSLRERMIGAEMFGRPIGYDTGNDSVVRVRASEVRKKLAQFYGEAGGASLPLRIELPSGSYVPRFHFSESDAKLFAENGKTVTARATSSAPVPVIGGHAAVGTGTGAAVAAGLGIPLVLAPAAGFRWRLAAGVVVAVVLAAAGFAVYRQWFAPSGAVQGIHSIAILPLKNLSGDPSQDYFADGMTEELINNLGQVSTLRVISLTSSMSYKGTQKNLHQIARELSVDAVVEGGILREGDNVRISAQLVDARTDRPLWAHTYVRNLTGVFNWQGEVAQTIADEISIKVTPQEQARLAQRRPLNPEAQDLFLRGLLLRQADDCKSAIDFFNLAIDRDPAFAEAHSALASCYGRLGESGRLPYQEAFTHQKAEALRAIELDYSLSEAHAELANSAMTLDWDWPTAAAEFHRALELNPSSATSHQKYAFYLVRTGHVHEALAEVERSVELDPISDSTFHAEGFIYFFSRQYDQALAIARTVRDLKIDLPDWNFLLGDIYAEKHMYPESIAAFLKSGDGPYTLGHLGNVYARAGEADKARKIIAQMQASLPRDGVGRYEIALIYAGLGEKTEAFKWLEDAYRNHDVGLVYLRVDPCLDPLRADPRFDDFLHRVGLS
jgi:TolB-like protein/tetratricopeptide (TPR) repeat protein